MSFKHLLAAGTALAAITGLGGAVLAQDEPVTITIINHESPRVEEQMARIEAATVLIDTGSGSVEGDGVNAKSINIDTGSGRIEIDTGSGGVRVSRG